jgi:glucuronate isomerase
VPTPPDRFFPAEPQVRATARALYREIAGLPLLSPHGHVDAGMLLSDGPYPDPVALLVRPDHYVLRLMHAHGATLEELGIAPRPGGGGTEPGAGTAAEGPVAGSREVWRRLCNMWPAFRGTVMRLWLEQELADLFGIDEPLGDGNAEATYDLISARLAEADMKPRALYRRFGLEVLATTDSPLDDLAAHRALLADETWDGRVVPTFRPDSLTDPAAGPGWSQRVSRLAEVSGVPTDNYRGFVRALETRREEFKRLGATATDHGHPRAEVADLGEWEAARIFDRIRLGRHDAGDEKAFSGHMLMEMARMSAQDGLVMQLHPGVWRSHDVTALARFGPDLGADFPVATDFTSGLARLLSRFGSVPGFRMVAFTVDETVYSRELAPMASYYPGLWLGAPWWFLDAPDAMMRFWSAVTESAGFAKSAGFVDDTRAYCSIPARHNLARRAHCSFLARLVHEHRLSSHDASELAADFAYHLPKKVFRL